MRFSRIILRFYLRGMSLIVVFGTLRTGEGALCGTRGGLVLIGPGFLLIMGAGALCGGTGAR